MRSVLRHRCQGGVFHAGGRAAGSHQYQNMRPLLLRREKTQIFLFHGQDLKYKLRMSLVMLKLAVTVLLRPCVRHHHHREHVRPHYRRLHLLLLMNMMSTLAVTVLLRPRMRVHHMLHVRPSHRRNQLSMFPLPQRLKKCTRFVKHWESNTVDRDAGHLDNHLLSACQRQFQHRKASL